jgi:formate dehydrogenase beta subunit
MLLLTLDRILQGDGTESDLEILSRMADILNDAAKCSVCQSAGELLKDGLTNFRDDFLAAVLNGVPEDSVRYRGNISAPCMNTCPCHINIPGYVEALQELRYGESLKIILEEVPLPGITGRICPAPCEKACSVANMGDVAIRSRHSTSGSDYTSSITSRRCKNGLERSTSCGGTGPRNCAALSEPGTPCDRFGRARGFGA